VWVLPGSHKIKHMDIPELVAHSGSERIDDAVPMLCAPGDVVISNRQLVHGSFANTSHERRITLNMGFFPRRRVANVTTTRLDGVEETYDAQRLAQRTRVIAVAIDARHQRFADESRYVYAPLAGREDENRWNEATRKAVIENYNVSDLYI
jgi:ectoine hydroxylase-related dioxygenase (phytanoyl-CoA dioxygenase family)